MSRISYTSTSVNDKTENPPGNSKTIYNPEKPRFSAPKKKQNIFFKKKNELSILLVTFCLPIAFSQPICYSQAPFLSTYLQEEEEKKARCISITDS